MKVLGVSYGYHDSSACLVVDGEVVAVAAEERFTRQKHDANFPRYAVEYVLAEGGITTGQLDQVVFHEDPHAKFSRVICSALAPFPGSRREFVNSTKAWLGRKLWSLGTLSTRLDVPPEKISYLSHHFSHAVQSFMGSGFEESGVLVVDAVGDWACSALFHGRWVDGRPQLERLMEIAFPNSLGLVYSAFTAYLGFCPNDSECSTMAMAGFGEPRYAEQVRNIIRAVEDDASYRVDQKFFNFSAFYKGAVSDLFLKTFGPQRDFRSPLPFRTFGDAGDIDGESQRFADLAASVQLVLEERILGLCEKLHEMSGSKRLCYAGGVSLNCVANWRLLNETPFEDFWIPPDPGDGGTAVGTALYYAAMQGDSQPQRMRYGPYLSPAFDENDDVELIDHLKPDHFLGYLKRGVPKRPGTQWRYEQHADSSAMCQAVAKLLKQGAIVGWYQGRGEIGPRALGNRSILIRPDDAELAERLSAKVKDRARFRPYAFSIAEEDALEAVDVNPEHLPFLKWMQIAVPIKPLAKEKAHTALHADDTTRIQVCSASDNPAYHQLLLAYGEESGLAALLNTSFNPSGYPIVNTPVEAMSMFARTDMDVLVLNNTIIWKDHAEATVVYRPSDDSADRAEDLQHAAES